MALNKDEVIAKMKERNFIVFATMPPDRIQFVSKHMYDFSYDSRVQPRDRMPVINVIINLAEDEFECVYSVPCSTNLLKCGPCGSVMNDDHFDSIVCKFESHAKWLSRIAS